MGLFVDELCSSVIVTHMLYKTALAIAIMRWVLSWAIRLRNRTSNDNENTSTTTTSTSNLFQSEDLVPLPSSSSSCPRDALPLTTFGEFRDRLPNCPCDTCAVCLNQFEPRDEVRELRNCCHVFHRDCLDTWLDHDRSNHHQNKTCPLCRSPFLTESQSLCLSSDSTRSQQPSWAVERLLYLFGDDLLL